MWLWGTLEQREVRFESGWGYDPDRGRRRLVVAEPHGLEFHPLHQQHLAP